MAVLVTHVTIAAVVAAGVVVVVDNDNDVADISAAEESLLLC